MSPPKLARLDPFLPLALLLAGFAAYPLLNPGLPVTSDGLLQPYRLVELDAALRAGTLYPRWAPDLWLGYGYPLFNFYAPLFYYLGEAFRLLGFDFESSVKAVVVLSLLLASSSAYLLGRRLFGRLGGVVTAAAYIYTPHFLTEVFHRGDYPQLLGLALLPLVLWCTERLAAEGGRKWLAASALSLSALLLTHSVTALLFAPVFALWLLLLLAAARQQRALILARLVTANLLALGLSAFFWLPAVAERPLVQTQRLLTGHFDFRLHFQSMNALLSPVSPTDPQLLNAPVSFGLGLSQVALAGIAITGLACMIAGRAFTSPPSPRPSERVGSEAVHPHPDPLPGGEGYVGAHGRTPQNGEIVPHPNPLPEVAGLPEAVSEGRQTRLCDQLVSEATLASDSSGRGSPVAKGDSPRRGEGCVGAHGRAPLRDEEIALHPSPLAEKEGTGSPSPHTERSPKANRLSPEVARLAIFTNLRTRRLWRATRRGEDEGLGGEVIVPHPDPLPEGEGSRQHSPAERRGEHEDRAEIRRPILPQLWAIAVVALAVLMMLPMSAPIWESSDFLALTQFPWRWLGIAGLGLAMLAGAAMRLLPPRWPGSLRVALASGALSLIIVGAFPLLYPILPFDRYTDLTVADVIRFELTRGPMGTSSGSEFLPRTVKSPPGRSPMVDEYLAGYPPTKLDLGALPPGVQARTLGHGPTWDEVEVDAPQGLGMLFRTLYFPGWKAYLDGRPAEVTPFETYGFALVAVPAGRHRVLLRFEDTPVRTAAQLISAGSVLVLLACLVWLPRPLRARGIASCQASSEGEAKTAPHPNPLPVGEGISSPSPFTERSPEATRLPEVARGDASRPDLATASRSPESPRTPTGHRGESGDLRRPPLAGCGEGSGGEVTHALSLGLLLVALLLAKATFIDGHTAWFRQPVAMQQPAGGPVQLGDKIVLLGYKLQPEQPESGQVWEVTLYWQGAVPVDTNYKSFTHLLTPDEARLVAQKDNEHPGLLPTSWWRQDKIVQDPHTLQVPGSLPPGRYPLVAGMYDPQSGDRLMPSDGKRSYVVIAYLDVQ